MSRDTGGPAFPMHPDVGNADECQGMTLRDYFAAHAPSPGEFKPEGESWTDFYARCNYAYADAMLAERAKP